MLGFAGHAHEFIDLVARAERFRALEQADGALGEIADEFFNHRDGGIGAVGDTEKNLEARIVLTAKAGVVWVGFAVEPVDGFQDADARRVIGESGSESGACATKKLARRENGEQVVGERRDGKQKKNIANRRPGGHGAILRPLTFADGHERNADADQQHAEPALRSHALTEK